MNIKNAWEETRIWLGWKRFKGVSISLRMALTVVIFILMWSLYWMYRDTNTSSVYHETIQSILDYGVNILLSAIAIIFILNFLWSFLMINKLPRNWHLVIEKAKDFQIQFGKQKSVYFNNLVGLAKIAHDGKGLYEYMLRYEELHEIKKKLAASRNLIVNEVSKQNRLIVKIRELEDRLR